MSTGLGRATLAFAIKGILHFFQLVVEVLAVHEARELVAGEVAKGGADSEGDDADDHERRPRSRTISSSRALIIASCAISGFTLFFFNISACSKTNCMMSLSSFLDVFTAMGIP